jgi:tRNA pseudouridine38-40 synthase
MAEKNIKLIIEYKGTSYSGWQLQADDRTIQDEIQKAIFKTTGCDVNLFAAGRTDAGVHALGQTANFKINHNLETAKYKDAINYYLDNDIIIKSSEEVAIDFHARFDAVNKRYRYLIGLEKSAINREFRWEMSKDLSFEILNKAAALIIGEYDFAPFCVVQSRKEDNRCIVEYAEWFKNGDSLSFEIRGNRFLHSMIRSLVGAMVNVADENKGQNKDDLTLERFGDIIQTQTDERVKFSAPAHGLYLVSVKY